MTGRTLLALLGRLPDVLLDQQVTFEIDEVAVTKEGLGIELIAIENDVTGPVHYMEDGHGTLKLCGTDPRLAQFLEAAELEDLQLERTTGGKVESIGKPIRKRARKR